MTRDEMVEKLQGVTLHASMVETKSDAMALAALCHTCRDWAQQLAESLENDSAVVDREILPGTGVGPGTPAAAPQPVVK